MKTSVTKCPSCKACLPPQFQGVCPRCYIDLTERPLDDDLHDEDGEFSSRKASYLRSFSSKLIQNFTEFMYNLVYFSEPNIKQVEEEDEYSEYLMEDYSTFYTDYDQLPTFASPPNRQPSNIPLRKASSCVEAKPSAQLFLPSTDTILTKKDSNVQTDDLFNRDTKAKDGIRGDIRSQSPTDSSSDDMQFFYRLGESTPKKGIIKETTIRKIYRSNSDSTRDTPIQNEKSFEEINHLSDSQEIPSSKNEKKSNLLKDLLDPDHASTFLRLVFNISIGIVLILAVYSAVAAIRDDFVKKREQEKDIILLEIQQCVRDYTENKCDPSTRLPAMETYCQLKEKCMSQDPSMVVKSSKMTASLVAEILNEFVEPLGLKTITFFFFLLFGMILICNCSLRPDVRRFEVKRNGEIEEINMRLERVERLSVKKSVLYDRQQDDSREHRSSYSKKYR